MIHLAAKPPAVNDRDDDELPPEVPAEGRLTTWANEPTASDLISDLDAAKPAHDTLVTKVRNWNDVLKAEGPYRPKHVEGRSKVQPKVVQRQAEWRIPALSEPFNSSPKLFTISPRTYEDTRAAEQNELVINYQFDTKIDRVALIDQFVRATVEDGTSALMLGWCRLEAKVLTEVPRWKHVVPDEMQAQAFSQALDMRTQDPEGFKKAADPALKAALDFFDETQQVTAAIQDGTEQVTVTKVVRNHPTAGMVNLENLYWDPSCGDDFDKALFVIRTFETCQADLKKEPDRYRNLDRVDWTGAGPIADPNHTQTTRDSNFQLRDPLRKRVIAYEYWGLWDKDGDGELKPVVCTWIGRVMIRCEDNPFPDGKPPFVLTAYSSVKRDVVGEPDAELLKDNQEIIGAVMRGTIDLMGRSANSQQGFPKGMLDVVNRRKFDKGLDYEYNPGSIPPEQAIQMHKYPEIPGSAMQMIQLQNEEAEALSGVKAFSQGISGDAYGSVASLGKSALDATAKREMAVLRRLASGLVKVGRKICAMNAAFLSEQEVIRVTNQPYVAPTQGDPDAEAKAGFVRINRIDLVGEYDLKVDISTPEIDQAKAQDLAFMIQTLGNTVDPSMTTMILAEIARLKRMPELEQKLRAWKPPAPTPEQQQQVQLELKKLQAELAKLQSEVELNKARAQVETVKADKLDLDRVEQEKGVTHAREMERMAAQSAGNQDLALTSALVKSRKPDETKPEFEAAAGWNALSQAKRNPRNSAEPDPVPNNPPVPPPVNPVEMPPMGISQ